MLRIEWGGKADAKSLLKEKPGDGSSETVEQVNSMSLKEGRAMGEAALGSCIYMFMKQ